MVTIILKNDKLSSYNRLGLFILLLHLLYFARFFLKGNTDVNFIAIVSGIGVSFIGLVLNVRSASKNNKPTIPFAAIFTALAIIWATLQNFGLTNFGFFAVMIIFAFLDSNVRKKPLVIFFEDRIEFNVFPRRTYQWQQMGNVILKDRILTLDFKNDRLIQTEIDEESWGVEEGEFNLFCKQHLF